MFYYVYPRGHAPSLRTSDLRSSLSFFSQWECLCRSQPVWAQPCPKKPCRPTHVTRQSKPDRLTQFFSLTAISKEERVCISQVYCAARHATSDGLLLPRVPSPFRLRADPGGWAGASCHQLYAGRWRSRREDQHDSQLHLQWIPDGIPTDWLWRLLRWVSKNFYFVFNVFCLFDLFIVIQASNKKWPVF